MDQPGVFINSPFMSYLYGGLSRLCPLARPYRPGGSGQYLLLHKQAHVRQVLA